MQPQLKIIVMVLTAWILSEIIKTTIDTIKNKKFTPRILLSYGGMPSSHSTFVVSVATSIFIVDGFSTIFLLSLAFVIIVIRDLITLRYSIDKNTENILELRQKVKMKGTSNENMLSHTPLEIICGVILGILVPLFLNLLF